MSRNLGGTYCEICYAASEQITLEETPRPARPEDCGRYFDEFKHVIFAAAHCTACGAKYLAWIVDPIRPWPRAPSAGQRFVDLSFRSTFNDEPGPDDLPPPEVLQRVHRERCLAKAREIRDAVELQLELARRLERDAETGTSSWEAYRRK